MKIEHSELFSEFIAFWFETKVNGQPCYETHINYLDQTWETIGLASAQVTFHGKLDSYSNERAAEEELRNIVTAHLLTKANGMKCSECGNNSLNTVVQNGSYYSLCANCESEGPSTSWLAIAPTLKCKLLATTRSKENSTSEFLAFGVGAEILQSVSNVANTGKLVFLSQEKNA
jgi:hypothetical protein